MENVAVTAPGGDRLCVVAAEGGNPRVIGPDIEDPDWSPDGDFLVGEYWSDPQKPDMVFHVSDENTQYLLIDGGEHSGVLRFPSWAPDGGQIVYSDESWIFRVDRDGTDRVKLTSLPNDRWFDLMPDWGPHT